MEVPSKIPQTKQEKVDHDATELDVNFETTVLDAMKIKQEPVTVEPHSYKPEPNIVIQNFNLTDEAKMAGNKEVNCLLNDISNEIGSQIKLEESKAIVKVEEMDDSVDVKWAIENDELIVKEEEKIEHEEHRKALTLVFRQQHCKEREASGSKKNISKYIFRCKQCEYRTTQKRYLELHLDLHNKSTTMIKCEFCEFKTVNRKIFNLHAAKHRLYKCDQCDYTGNKRNLNRHVFKHKNPDEVDKYILCDQCDYKTFHKQDLKKHILKHKSSEVEMYKCGQCDYQTIYKHYLKTHSIKHQNADKVDLYKCDYCNYQTVHKYYLKTHSLNHQNSVKMYKCDQCKYQTIYKRNLNRHSLKHKNSDEVGMYKCDKCDYQAIQKRHLQTHFLTHKSPDQVTFYKCDHCNYATVLKESFKRHIVKHKA